MKVLLISTYDLGHQPFGLASPTAWLIEAGADLQSCDLSVDPLDTGAVIQASLVAIYLPMHTATRLAEPVIRRIQALNSNTHICCFGLYAPMNFEWLKKLGVHSIIGGEFEQVLTKLYRMLDSNTQSQVDLSQISLQKQKFLTPNRSTLPPLNYYGNMIWPDGRKSVIGYTEASRGCKHRCRHCPVVPVYSGQFRVIQTEIILEDIRQLVRQGAEHITFGDPDFLNGPGHAKTVIQGLHSEFPKLTYDVVIKIEHLLQHSEILPVLRQTGCLFITSAVESVEDQVLNLLDKGHTSDDFISAVKLCRNNGIFLSPTFIPFTPWTTTQGYIKLLSIINALNLVECVAPIQLAIRLLVPEGSRLRELIQWREHEGEFDQAALSYKWRHNDPSVDLLYDAIREAVTNGEKNKYNRRQIFENIWSLAHSCTGDEPPKLHVFEESSQPPRMSESWYCCAEPTENQISSM